MTHTAIVGEVQHGHEAAAAARREEILDAAAALFARRGYSETDTQLLAETLNVGKGTLYRYFPSKQELFWPSPIARCGKLREQVDAAIADVEEPLERIRRRHPRLLDLLRRAPGSSSNC